MCIVEVVIDHHFENNRFNLVFAKTVPWDNVGSTFLCYFNTFIGLIPRWDKVHQVMNVDHMNIQEHSSMVYQASSWTVFMNCSSITVHDKSWILMNTWWTNIVHDFGMISWFSYGEFHEQSWIFMNLPWSIQFIACSWKFMREFNEFWRIIMSLINLNSVHGYFMKIHEDSLMNCDKFLWAWNLNLVHGLFMKAHELWWMTA